MDNNSGVKRKLQYTIVSEPDRCIGKKLTSPGYISTNYDDLCCGATSTEYVKKAPASYDEFFIGVKFTSTANDGSLWY